MSAELERELKQTAPPFAMARETETRVQTALEAWFAWDVEIRVADSAIDQMELNIENPGVTNQLRPTCVSSALRINTSFEESPTSPARSPSV